MVADHPGKLQRRDLGPGLHEGALLRGTASGDQTAPVSPWLLEGHTGGDVTGQTPIVESDNGLAWDLAHDGDPSKTAKVDPHAVVLAYSWLDGAAPRP